MGNEIEGSRMQGSPFLTPSALRCTHKSRYKEGIRIKVGRPIYKEGIRIKVGIRRVYA